MSERSLTSEYLTLTVEQLLNVCSSWQIGEHRRSGAHVMEPSLHSLWGDTTQLGPGLLLDRQLQGIGRV